MPEQAVEPPGASDATALADWVELWLFVEEEDELTRDAIKRRLRDEPEDQPEEPDDERVGAEIEVAGIEKIVREDRRTDLLLSEVIRRSEVVPRIYGLRVKEEIVSRVQVPGGSIYDLLRWVCQADAPFRGERMADVELPLDELALETLKVLLGTQSQGVLFARRYATDPATETTRPESFPEAVRWLRARVRLKAGLELVPDGPPDDDEADHPARTYSDGGVDVVAWRPFKDGRAGFLIALGQCTIQANWKPKANDISLPLWGDWIRFVTGPQKVLVIPYAVPDGRSWWRDRTRTAGLIVDRMRLCELLNELEDEQLGGLAAAQMADWIWRERDAYRVARAV